MQQIISTFETTPKTLCMKKAILTLLSLAFYLCSYSQTNGNYNYSLVARAFSIIQLPKLLNQTDQPYLNTYFNGAMLKFNDNQISYRLSANYLNKSTSFNNNCANCELADGKTTDYSVKIGFEKSFNYSGIQPYFAMDAGFRSTVFKGVINNTNPQRVTVSPSSIEGSKNGFVASPVLGIKLNPIPMISIFAESNLEFFYSYERQETVALDASNYRTLNKYYKTEFLLNPVSVGIQIHLGTKD